MLKVSQFQDSSVVITGGLGFIGSNLANRLVCSGADVQILDANLENYGGNRKNIGDISEEVTVVEEDVRDFSAVERTVDGADYVFHLAAQLSRPISMDCPKVDIDINCTGTINVLEALRGGSAATKCLFASSQAVYGQPNSLPIDESTEPTPIDMYGTNKLAAEHYCRLYTRRYDIDATSLRLTNVYGPRAQLKNPKYGVINRFIKLSLEDRDLPVFEPGTMLRDFIHVDDVVDAFLSAAMTDTNESEYLIASGKSVSVKQLAETITHIADSGRVQIKEWPDDWDGIRVGDIEADPSTFGRHCDWSPDVPLEEGLERTLKHYDEHFEDYL